MKQWIVIVVMAMLVISPLAVATVQDAFGGVRDAVGRDELPGPVNELEWLVPNPDFCPIPPLPEDPLYASLCALANGIDTVLRELEAGEVTIEYEDGELVHDADGDGRADVARLDLYLPIAVDQPGDDPDSDCYIDDGAEPPEADITGCPDWDGQIPIETLYLQLDYFRTDGDENTPDEWYGIDLSDGFDVAINQILLYDPTTGEQQDTELSDGTLRLSNVFRDFDLALYFTGDASHALGAPGGQDLPGGGRCIVCVDLDKNRIVYDEDPEDYKSDPSALPYSGGLIDLDVIGITPSNPLEASIEPRVDGSGDPIDATPTTILFQRGFSAREHVESVRSATTQVWPDRAGLDLSTIHIKWPQDPGQAYPDFARWATAYSNIDDDASTDWEEINCGSNPSNSLAHCLDYDGDGLPNDSDPAQYNPLILTVESSAGDAPFDPVVKYNCPTDASYQLNLGDVDDGGSSVTMTSSSSGDLKLLCGQGEKTINLEAVAGGKYLNSDTGAERKLSLVLHAGQPSSGVAQEITIAASKLPVATLDVTGDGGDPPVEAMISYSCSVDAPAVITSAVLRIEQPNPDAEDLEIDVTDSCSGGTIEDQVFHHLSATADANRIVPLNLTVNTNQHPAIDAFEEKTVIVGSHEPPQLTISSSGIATGEAPLDASSIEVTVSCTIPSGDTFVSAELDFGSGDPVVLDDCTGGTFQAPAGILNPSGSEKIVNATLSVTTTLAGGPYTAEDTIAIVDGNAIEPGQLIPFCTGGQCPADGSIPSSDKQPGNEDDYQIRWGFVPEPSPEGQLIEQVVFQEKSGTTTWTTIGTVTEFDTELGAWALPFRTLGAEDTKTVRAIVHDNGGRSGVADTTTVELPEDLQVNADPNIDDFEITEDLSGADGTTVAMSIWVDVTDEGPARSYGSDEDDEVTVTLHYWPADDDADVAEVALTRIATCSPVEAEGTELKGCEDHEDGSTANGERFEASFRVDPFVDYMFIITAVDKAGASDATEEFRMDRGTNQEAIIESVETGNNALDALVAAVEEQVAQVQDAVEEAPDEICGEGNGSDPEACLRHRIHAVCQSENASSDPTQCQGDQVEAVVNTVIDAVNQACTNGGTIGDDCIDRHLENITRIVDNAFQEIVCGSLARDLLTVCGGSPDTIPIDPLEFVGNSDCTIVKEEEGDVGFDPDCGSTDIDSPLGQLDQSDPHDTNGNDETDEPNGQIDLIESRFVYINPDQPAGDSNDPWAGRTGATLHVLDPTVFFQEPRPLLTVRVGDVSGTDESERLVIQTYSEGVPESVICIYTQSQAGGSAPAVFVKQGTAFRGDDYCGEIVSTSNLRISQSTITSEGRQGMVVWMDHDNDGIRNGTDSNADASQKSREDVAGFSLAPSDDGFGLNLSVIAGHAHYAIHVRIDGDGHLRANGTLSTHDGAAGLGLPGGQQDEHDAHYNTHRPLQSSGNMSAGGFENLNVTALFQGAGIDAEDSNGDGAPDSIRIEETVENDDVGDQSVNETVELPTDASLVNGPLAALLASLAEGSPELPSGFGPIDDNEDGVPEGVWVDQDSDGERADDGSEDTYFADADPETLVALAEQIGEQVSEAVDEQVGGAVDTVAPPCDEADEGMPCQEAEDRTSLRSMLGLPGKPIRVPLPTGGGFWI